MATDIVFETHSWSDDNERGIATGWLPGRLSPRGRELAAMLGRRRRDDGIAAVFTSDLRRAVETTTIAFGHTDLPVLHDWRLRECDFGSGNGAPVARIRERRAAHLDVPFPGGESWRQAVARVGGFLSDLPSRWDGTRVLVIGHVATSYALDHYLRGTPLEKLVGREFAWQEGWEYRLDGGIGDVPAGYARRMSDKTPEEGGREWEARTGAEQEWDPEDLAVAEGRDPTPANVARAAKELEEEGPGAIERTVP